jgi:predicted esterase
MAPRKVKLAFDDTSTTAGPLVIYWHATGSAPVEAAYSLGDTEGAITAAGGVVAAPYADPAAGQFEWFIVNQSTQQDDFLLADEVVACLAAAHRIDTHHIHSMGMSAGALQTTAVSFVRANYIASVATYSGGVPSGFMPTNQRPDNKFAALIFDGGASDNVFGVDFQAASMTYDTMLTGDGHYAELCDHGMGHNIPLDAAPSVAAFFAANGYGQWPSPYASAGVPASFPSYCAR